MVKTIMITAVLTLGHACTTGRLMVESQSS